MLKDIFDLNMRMASISRFSQTHLVMGESVLEHTGGVALMCYLIAETIDGDIDMGKLLSRAVVHDIDEIVTGDIPTPTKYKNERITSAIKEVEEENMHELSDSLLGSSTLYRNWKHSKDDSIEGAILATADLLSVLYKLWQETVLYNNRTMKEHIENIGGALERKARMYAEKYSLTDIYEQAFGIYEEIKENAY